MKTLSELLKENNIRVNDDSNVKLIDAYLQNPHLNDCRNTIAARVFRSIYENVAQIYLEFDIVNDDKITLEAGVTTIKALQAISNIE